MLVWDMRYFYGLTLFRSDFIDYMKCDIPVKEVNKVNKVIGIGITLHKLIDRNGQGIFLSCISYHLNQSYLRLVSPQTYHQIHGGHYIVPGNQVTMQLQNHRIQIPMYPGETNLPVIHNSFVTDHQRREIGPKMRSSLAYSRLSKPDVFGDLKFIQYLQDMDISSNQMEI